jgi:hypothetical protein
MSALLLLAGLAFAGEAFEGNTYYFGDLHAHTGASGDGGSSDLGTCEEGASCGSVAGMIDVVKAEGLDFFATTDHVNGRRRAPDDEAYATVFQTMLDGNEPGSFLTIPGAEVFFTLEDRTRLGHKVLLLFGDDEALADFGLTDAQHEGGDTDLLSSCEAIDTYMTDLQATWGDALLIPHHPAATRIMPTDWSCHSPQWSPAVEVYSSHGNSRSSEATFDPLEMGVSESGTVDMALDPSGYALELGFVGGTDSHDTLPGTTCSLDGVRSHAYGGGLTAAVLPEGETLSRAALYQAIVDRRTYATSGVLIPVDLQVSIDGEVVAGLGEQLEVDADQTLSVSAGVPEGYRDQVQSVYLVTPDGEALVDQGEDLRWTWAAGGDQAPEWAYFMLLVDGDLYYADGACEDGGADTQERIWLSPNWFIVRTSGDTGDTGGGDTGDTGGVDTGDTGVPPDTGDTGSPDDTGDTGGSDTDDTGIPPDTGDTGGGDTGDTGGGDTGDTDGGDTGGGDTGGGDTGTGDTGTGDTDTGDTGGADTGGADTGGADTGDTGGADTGEPGDTTPPVISELENTTRAFSARVAFSTDEPATGEICTDKGYCHETEQGTSHSQIFLLRGATTYTVTATDEAGNVSSSGPHSF